MADPPDKSRPMYTPQQRFEHRRARAHVRHQRPDPRSWRVEAAALVDEIIATGARLSAARGAAGDSILRADAEWRLLRALERTSYCLSISDVGRAMRTSRQTAHALVRAVAAIGLIELLTNPDDRRLVQVRLTPLGRAALADWQAGEALWVITLLNGLDTHAIRATTHILYVIRQRLARNERELSRPGRARAPRHHRSGRPNVYSRNP